MGCSIAFIAATALAPAVMVRGVLVISSPIGICSALPPVRLSARRRSPSARGPTGAIARRVRQPLSPPALSARANGERGVSACAQPAGRACERPEKLPPVPDHEQQPEPPGGHLRERVHQQRRCGHADRPGGEEALATADGALRWRTQLRREPGRQNAAAGAGPGAAPAHAEHVGRSFVRMSSLVVRMRRFPSFPAGWFMAYSSVVSFFAWRTRRTRQGGARRLRA